MISILKRVGFFAPGLAGGIALRVFTSPKAIPRPEWEKELIAQGAPIVFKNGTHGTSWGQSDAPVVFLVHGWQGRGAQLGKLVEPLVDRGLRVIAWDGPAHGESPGRMTNARMFAALLSEAAGEIAKGKPVLGVIAHSFGAGATTLAVAKGWLKVEKLVLVAAPADLEWVLKSFSHRMKLTPRVEKAFRRKLEAWVGMSTAEVGIARLAPLLSTPVLIVHDKDDEDVPFSDAEKIVREWKGARLISLTGVGHRRILKSPDFIQAATNFIAET